MMRQDEYTSMAELHQLCPEIPTFTTMDSVIRYLASRYPGAWTMHVTDDPDDLFTSCTKLTRVYDAE